MKNHFTTFAAAILIAAVAASAAPQQQDVVPPGGFVAAYATGTTDGSGVKAGENQDAHFNNDLDFQMFSGSGSATDSATFTQGQTMNVSQGNVSLGVIRMSGSNSAPNSSSFPSGAVNAGWSDIFTIDAPGRAGQSGLLLAAVGVHGTLFAQGFAGSTAVHITGYKDEIGLPTRPEFDGGNSDSIGTEGQFAQWGASSDFSTVSRTIDDQVTFAVPFVFSQSFELGVYAFGRAGMRSQSGVQGVSTSNFDFGQSFTWEGVAGVTTGGQPVTDYTLTSASGVDWTQPIPEPAAALLLGSLAVMGACRRRRGR